MKIMCEPPDLEYEAHVYMIKKITIDFCYYYYY